MADHPVRSDDATVRCTLDAKWSLPFPDRRDQSDVASSVVRPTVQAARTAIAKQAIADLQRGDLVPC